MVQNLRLQNPTPYGLRKTAPDQIQAAPLLRLAPPPTLEFGRIMVCTRVRSARRRHLVDDPVQPSGHCCALPSLGRSSRSLRQRSLAHGNPAAPQTTWPTQSTRSHSPNRTDSLVQVSQSPSSPNDPIIKYAQELSSLELVTLTIPPCPLQLGQSRTSSLPRSGVLPACCNPAASRLVVGCQRE
jgi:hypothetical protein